MEDKYKTKFARIMGVAKAIQGKSGLNREDLARLCGGVTVQTVSNYITFLKDVLGYPIYFNQSKGCFEFYREDYQEVDNGFTVEDIIILLLALDSVKNLAGVEIYTLQLRLISLLPEKLRDDFEQIIESLGLHQIKEEEEGNVYYINKTNRAILEEKKIELNYKPSQSKQINSKKLTPYGLAWQRDKCYLIAKGDEGDLIINYRLDRIKDLKITNERGKIPNNFNLKDYLAQSWKMFSGELKRVILKFNNSLRVLVEDEFEDGYYKIIEEDEENFTLKSRIRGLQGLKIWLLSLGSGVEVIEPKSLRNDILQTAQELVEKYQN